MSDIIMNDVFKFPDLASRDFLRVGPIYIIGGDCDSSPLFYSLGNGTFKRCPYEADCYCASCRAHISSMCDTTFKSEDNGPELLDSFVVYLRELDDESSTTNTYINKPTHSYIGRKRMLDELDEMDDDSKFDIEEVD